MTKNLWMHCNKCGQHGEVNENDINWNENETGDCPQCGKELSFTRDPNKQGYCWVDKKTD